MMLMLRFIEAEFQNELYEPHLRRIENIHHMRPY